MRLIIWVPLLDRLRQAVSCSIAKRPKTRLAEDGQGVAPDLEAVADWLIDEGVELSEDGH